MKNSIKTAGKTAKNVSITVASKVLGATDFIGQSVSDISQELEAKMKLKAYGVDKEDTKRSRVIRTKEHQQKFIDLFNKAVNLTAKNQDEDEVIIMQIQHIQ
mgnify:CR=1 FL=1